MALKSQNYYRTINRYINLANHLSDAVTRLLRRLSQPVIEAFILYHVIKSLFS